MRRAACQSDEALQLCRVWGFMVQGSGFKGSGFRVSELIMQGLGLMVPRALFLQPIMENQMKKPMED